MGACTHSRNMYTAIVYVTSNNEKQQLPHLIRIFLQLNKQMKIFLKMLNVSRKKFVYGTLVLKGLKIQKLGSIRLFKIKEQSSFLMTRFRYFFLTFEHEKELKILLHCRLR